MYNRARTGEKYHVNRHGSILKLPRSKLFVRVTIINTASRMPKFDIGFLDHKRVIIQKIHPKQS